MGFSEVLLGLWHPPKRHRQHNSTSSPTLVELLEIPEKDGWTFRWRFRSLVLALVTHEFSRSSSGSLVWNFSENPPQDVADRVYDLLQAGFQP